MNRRSWLIAIAGLGFAGCSGSDGPARYDLSDSVTLGGKSVPAGKIVLEPDSSKGNKGPGTSAVIKDGKYATPDGLGRIGGAYVATVSAFDGKQLAGDEAETRPMGNALAKPQEFRFKLESESATYDFPLSP